MVLCDSHLPQGQDRGGVALAVRYCRARGWTSMKRPVHVVPMYRKALSREVETVWPGIAEVQTTASRTGCGRAWTPRSSGLSKTRVFRGPSMCDGRQEQGQVEVTYPEWAEVTVYTAASAASVRPSRKRSFWEESYATKRAGRNAQRHVAGASAAGSCLKCAKAASPAGGFPEEAGYTAEEMAGKAIEADSPGRRRGPGRGGVRDRLGVRPL